MRALIVRPTIKASELSPACACPVAQQATMHGQTSSVPAEGSGGGRGAWHRALGTTKGGAKIRDCVGSTAWSYWSELLLAIGRGGLCRD